MSTWYYQHAGQEVGPFQVELLGQLAHAGIIGDSTLVRNTDLNDWQPLSTVLPRQHPAAVAADPCGARYYYLDASDQPVGPFNLATVRRLHAENVLFADTLVSAVGDPEWVPAASLLNLPVLSSLAPASPVSATASGVPPRQLPFERYVLLTTVTLGLYPFYLVPCQSRDLKAITGRERMEFTLLLILGIVTLSLLLLVMQVIYAFDLERHGKTVHQAGRQESLGTLVLVLTVLGVVLSFAIDNGFVSYVVGTLFGSAALWMVQKEINLYATAPSTSRPA